MGRIIGIDLGTTYSVVATPEMGGIRILYNREGEQSTRSVVGWDKGEFLVGSPAWNRWQLAPKDTIISIKRLMGRAMDDPQVKKVKEWKWCLYDIVEPSDGTKDSVRVLIDGKEFSPIDISAMILRKLKSDAEYVLGEEVSHAVITVPAYFSDKQRQATREAGRRAGLTVMKIIDEPTAAAIAFGIDSREKEAKTILVYDLGGGTFDVSVLVMTAGTFTCLDKEGDMWLGGDDFDQAIVDHILNYLKKKFPGVDFSTDIKFMTELKKEAQKAKEALSAQEKTQIIIPALRVSPDNIIPIEIEITRKEFEILIEPFIAKTLNKVEEALKNSHLTKDDIDYVLMAGSSTLIPLVQKSMEGIFGKEKILRKIHPKHCVAYGAAVMAAVYQAVQCPKCYHDNDLKNKICEKCGEALAGLILCPYCSKENEKDAEICGQCGCKLIGKSDIEQTQIAPFSYGVQSVGDVYTIFVEKGEPFETPEENRKTKTFYTQFPGQRILSIPIYGGDILECASKNQKQGEVYAILPPDCPAELPVKVKLWLDRDGIFVSEVYLETPGDLESWILRGEADQKAIEIFVKAEEGFSQIKNIIGKEQRKTADNKKNAVIDSLQKKEFEIAVERAQEFLKYVESIGRPSVDSTAKNISKYAKHILNTYEWLLKDIHKIQLATLIEELETAINKKDIGKMEENIKKMENLINELMIEDDNPTIIGLIELNTRIIVLFIRPTDIVKGESLLKELSKIVENLKIGKPESINELVTFTDQLLESIQKMAKKCPNCGKPIASVYSRYCENCNWDLWIPVKKD